MKLPAGFCLLLLLTLSAPMLQAQNSGLRHRVILIGDGGRLEEGRSVVAEAAAGMISPGDGNVSIIFLGDNIYDKGLPAEDDPGYAESVEILRKQLEPFAASKAPVYVIPGNHDWEKSGPQGWEYVRRQAALVDSMQGKRIRFLPQGGCPGPVEVELGEDITLVVLDTQWWLHPYDKPGIESECECQTEDEVLAALQDIAWRNRGKQILLATHHPFRTLGIHGGYYTFKQHLFPLTDLNPSLYIPLPVIGSIYPLARGVFGDVQDLKHPLYRNMVRSVEEALELAPDITWVAGHDHSLQWIEEEGRQYVVSGSAINVERVRTGSNTKFAASRQGFAEILFFGDKRRELRFYGLEPGKDEPELLFSAELPPAPAPRDEEQDSLPRHFPDSVTRAVAPEYEAVGKLHRFFFGDNYRSLWASPVSMRVFLLEQEKGGMQILKKGGGMQTLSLRLADTSGKEWNLRTVQKNPEKALPPNLRESIARRILQDQISAAHPFGALAVPPLAEALGIPHARPELVFVPDDPALGQYRKDFAGKVFTLEEREPVPDDTKSTSTVLEKLEEDNDHSVDQKALLKARLLDMLIGDWDRHADQWRWGKIDKEHGNLYFPVPRDRDQVFFINDGLIPSLAARKWAMPKFQGFSAEIRDVNGFNYNARHFDRRFLHELEEEDWKETAALVQEKLGDTLFARAVQRMPPSIARESGPAIVAALRSRRERLEEYALEYYRFLAKGVDIPGTSQKEFFEISYEEDGEVRVKGSKVKNDSLPGRKFYERSFKPGETREIRIYGQDNEDIFRLSGAAPSPIRLRLIGGGEPDSFRIGEEVRNRRRIFIYDRSDRENGFPSRRQARFRTSAGSEVNEYDPMHFQYDRLMPLVTAGFNLDDGILLGGGFQYIHHAFRKDPYASRSQFQLGHALATSAWFVRYHGEFRELVGSSDFFLDIDARAPHNTSNFFGAGNESEFIKEGSSPIQRYRTRFSMLNAALGLRYPVSQSVSLFAGPLAQFYRMEADENEGRFIMDYAEQNPQERLFATKWFGGLRGGFEIDTRNDAVVPSRGLYWTGSLEGARQLGGQGQEYAQLKTELSVFTSFQLRPRLVIANRIGGGYTFGDPDFYQLLYLGGRQNLRGYRNFRFAGERMFYHNIELRLKLFDFVSYLFPGSVGLQGFHDIGRVWQPGESSGRWHRGAGGGLYLVPAEKLVISGTIGFSEEETLPYISLGFQF